MLNRTMNDIKKYWDKFKSIIGRQPKRSDNYSVLVNNNNTVIVEKNSVRIVIGDDIEISDANRKMVINKDLEITVEGDCTIQAKTVKFKTPDAMGLKCNTIPNCLFSGTPHSTITTITGENID